VASTSIFTASLYILSILLGTNNLLIWLFMGIELVAAIAVIYFGARFLVWYRVLKRRYSNLLEMEMRWRKTNT